MDPIQTAMNLIVINERGWVAALQAHEDPDTQMAQGILLAALGGSESMEIALFVHNAILHLVGRHDLVNSRGQLPRVENTPRMQAELERLCITHYRPVGGIQ